MWRLKLRIRSVPVTVCAIAHAWYILAYGIAVRDTVEDSRNAKCGQDSFRAAMESRPWSLCRAFNMGRVVADVCNLPPVVGLIFYAV